MARKKRPKLVELKRLDQIKALSDHTRMRVMEAIGDGASVTEVAHKLDVPRTRLYHHIKVLEDKGLIQVRSTRKAGAIEEKVYETAAESFKIAPEIADEADASAGVEAILAIALDTTKADLHQSLVSGIAREGESYREKVGIGRSLAKLSQERADELIAELRQLVDKYCEDEDEGADAYAFVWTVYPTSTSLGGLD